MATTERDLARIKEKVEVLAGDRRGALPQAAVRQAQFDAVVQGLNDQIAALRKEVKRLKDQIEAL